MYRLTEDGKVITGKQLIRWNVADIAKNARYKS
jgi:hypothetical protein